MKTIYTDQGFNSLTIKHLRDDLSSLVAKYNINDGADLGIQLDLGSATYGKGEATIKLNVTVDGILTKEQEAVAMFTDFKYGSKIKHRGKPYTIIGYKTRSPKKPVIIRDSEGGEYKCTDSFLTNVEVL